MKNNLIYCREYKSFYKKYLNNIISNYNLDNSLFVVTNTECDVIDNDDVSYKVLDKLKYFSENNDYKEYFYLFEYCIEQKISHLHIVRINYDIFYSVLSNYINLPFTISFGVFGLREILETQLRLSVFNKILSNASVKSVLLHIISNEVPENLSEKFTSFNKIFTCGDPIYDDRSVFLPNNNTKKRRPVIKYLYFGNFFFGKGVDLFIEAILEANKSNIKNLEFTIAGDLKSVNFNLDYQLHNLPNVKFYNHFLSEIEVANLLSDTDYVVLPYRKSYELDTSGVFVQAALMNKLIIAPSFYPFGDVLQKYNIGLSFESENVFSLSRTIVESSLAYEELLINAKFEDFINSINSWEEMTNKIFDKK
jgi:glycosyltransferase involved in cell wall biosynthesis